MQNRSAKGWRILLCSLFAYSCSGGVGQGAMDDAMEGVPAVDGGDSAAPEVPVGPSGDFFGAMTVAGGDRTYELYVPETAVAASAQGPVPLLMTLHSAGALASPLLTLLEPTADANAFLLVGPDAYQHM